MQLAVTKLYTDPKISPIKPDACDMSKNWYVWFRFFDASKGKWIQLRFNKGINRYTVYRQRLAEANALKQTIKEELANGWNPLNGPEQTVKIYSLKEGIEYVLKVKEATLRTKTKYAYRYITGLFLKWLKSKNAHLTRIDSFTTSQAQEYMDWLLMDKKYSGRTYNDHLIVLRTFFNCFGDREWISKNPFRIVKRKTQTVGRNLAYSEQEKVILLKHLRQHDIRMYYFTQLMYHTFIRRTELTCLQVKHVDLINYTIVIPGKDAKNNHQESVVIPKGLEPILQEMQLQQYDPEDYIFGRCLETGFHQYKNPNWISTRHNDIVKKLNLPAGKGLYSWKHSGVCDYYYLTNKDVYAIMRQLRHRDLNTTMIYLKSMGLIQNEAFRNAMVA